MAQSHTLNDTLLTTNGYGSCIDSDLCDFDGFMNYDNDGSYLNAYDADEQFTRSCELEQLNNEKFGDDQPRFSSLPEKSCSNDKICENGTNANVWTLFTSYFNKPSQPIHDHGDKMIKNENNSELEKEKFKNKCLSTWNNMRNGWVVKTKIDFRRGTPVFLLGKKYCFSIQEREFQKFLFDFTSKFWFTYRQNFKPLLSSTLTSDVGWGCMLRTGQMMMAQAFTHYLFGREWNWSTVQNSSDISYHRKIVKMFAEHLHSDTSYTSSPFSIHRLVEIGQNTGKQVGDWYGPASVAYVLRDALNDIDENLDKRLAQLRMYIAPDCTVYHQDILDLCSSSGNDQEGWHPLILVIPVRLGGIKMNDVYVPCIQNMLSQDMCLGIVGGEPKHSVYFIGHQEDRLIYLDPHYCQKTVDITDEDFELESFHCKSPRKMSFSKMDPSCTIAFFIRTKKDLDVFISEAPRMASVPHKKGSYPLFVCSSGRNADVNYEESANEKYLRIDRFDKNGQLKSKNADSDDFVLL